MEHNTHIEVAELDIDGMRVREREFDNVISASHYRNEEDGYEETVAIEWQDEDGAVHTETIHSEYRVDITHVEHNP